MRIEVIKNIDSENREVFGFNLFDTNAVFVAWHKEEKPKGKRKWTIKAFWDKYNSRHSIHEEPELPEEIRIEAKAEVVKLINVNTWDEWKSR